MSDATAKTEAPAKEKKAKKKRFPPSSDFPNKGAYLEHMIKLFQDKLADYKKNGDGEKAKKIKKGRKVLDQLDDLMKDPDTADIIAEARKKLAGKGAPAK